jgi:hypothetical protein
MTVWPWDDTPASNPDFVEAVARRVAELLIDQHGRDVLLTAQDLAARLGVHPSWVYAHAAELGALRLGRGPKAPLRFDPDAVLAALRNGEESLPPPPEAPPRTRSKGLIPIREG